MPPPLPSLDLNPRSFTTLFQLRCPEITLLSQLLAYKPQYLPTPSLRSLTQISISESNRRYWSRLDPFEMTKEK